MKALLLDLTVYMILNQMKSTRSRMITI